MSIINVDGGFSNGSQILRDALALSLITGKAFRLNNFQPLNNNHLGYIKAAATIGNAQLDGNVLGSNTVTFIPGVIQSGLLTIASTAANNIGLTIQTILPALARNYSPSIIQIKGGTNFPNSPTIDFISDSYLPLINKMGGSYSVHCPQRGFYPSGGGRVQLEVHPSATRKPLTLLDRGKLISRQATVINASLPGHIPERELALARVKLGWNSRETKILFDNSPDPGNVLNLEMVYENITILYANIGQRGIHAEEIAEQGIKQVLAYLASTAPVDEHLAHQLIIPMLALGGGQFLTTYLSDHTKSLIMLLKEFAPGNVTIKPQGINNLISVKAI